MELREKQEFAKAIEVSTEVFDYFNHSPTSALNKEKVELLDRFLKNHEIISAFFGEKNGVCAITGEKGKVRVLSVLDRSKILAIDAYEQELSPQTQAVWKKELVEKSKVSGNVSPFLRCYQSFKNMWNDPLSYLERDYLRSVMPESTDGVVIKDKTLDKALEKVALYDEVLRDKLRNYIVNTEFKGSALPEDLEDRLAACPELLDDTRLQYGTLELFYREAEGEDPMIAFGHWSEERRSWSAKISPDRIDERDLGYVDNADTLLKNIIDNFESRRNEQWFKDRQTAEEFIRPIIDEHLDKLRSPNPFTIEVKENERFLYQVFENRIFETVQERWKERRADIENKTKETLTPENRKVFDTLIRAYSLKPELKENPRLIEALERRLLPVFINAQEKGFTLQLNKYSLDAPSRNPTVVQLKQPSREKEK